VNETILLVGAGNMGEALIRGWLAAKTVAAHQIIACDVRADRLEYLKQTFGVRSGPAPADVVVLAVKPQQLTDALVALRSLPPALYVSILAGVTTGRIERELGGQPRVVRVMPNTPALVGAGAAGICPGAFAREADVALVEQLFRAVGVVVRTEERLMDAVTALSGSGPAYIFHVAEAMIAAGVAQGMSEVMAKRLTVQTIFGAARLLAEGGESAATLRQKVTSPGGTTEAALKVMSERKLMEIFRDAIAAATKRGRELSGG
jgi:pyrroline-5-carboxylate reductase